MKFYVLMTSLALAAGAALGFWTGQGSAETEFAQGCADMGIVVVYDHRSESHRHFHCFELDEDVQPPTAERPAAPDFVAL